MSNVQHISGVVEVVTRDGKSIKVNGEFYGAYRANELEHVSKGDHVEFDYKVNGKWRNIWGKVQVQEVPESSTPQPAAKPAAVPKETLALSKDRIIVRQNATSNASRIVSAFVAAGKLETKLAAAATLKLAAKFESYCMGDTGASTTDDNSEEKEKLISDLKAIARTLAEVTAENAALKAEAEELNLEIARQSAQLATAAASAKPAAKKKSAAPKPSDKVEEKTEKAEESVVGAPDEDFADDEILF